MRTDAPTGDRRMPRNVRLLGLISLLSDVGSEMVLPLLPAFVTSLGGGARALGWIEGIANAVASVLKLVAGRWSDRVGRNRPFVIAGYGLAAAVRPLFALASAPWHVAAIRAIDRVGKGLRTSPRDALIAASVTPERRGAAFGLHRAMDHTGAFLGPTLAFLLIALWAVDVRAIFLLTVIPGALAVLVAVFGVREVRDDGATVRESAPAAGRALARVLVPVGLFTLAGASELFLLMKAGAENAPLVAMPLLWIGLHAVKSALAAPGGRLADRIGKTRALAIGWLVHAALFVAFAFVDDRSLVIALVLLHGVRCALTEGAEKALIAGLAPKGTRGTAFGCYHLVQGTLALGGAAGFGELWERCGAPTAFLGAAACAVLAVVTIPRRRRLPAA